MAEIVFILLHLMTQGKLYVAEEQISAVFEVTSGCPRGSKSEIVLASATHFCIREDVGTVLKEMRHAR